MFLLAQDYKTQLIVSIKLSNTARKKNIKKKQHEKQSFCDFCLWKGQNVIDLQKKIHSNNTLLKNISPSLKALLVLNGVKIIQSLHEDTNNHTQDKFRACHCC